MIDRSGCPAKQHGTASAYTYHKCRCSDTREAFRIYRLQLRHGTAEPGLVPVLGSARRLQALGAMGWTQETLAGLLGVSEYRVNRVTGQHYRTVNRKFAAKVDALYRKICDTPGGSDKARRWAESRGWAPPMAWELEWIDDPNRGPDWLPVRVEHARFRSGFGDGYWVRPEPTARKLQALHAIGWSMTELAHRLGMAESMVRGITRQDHSRLQATTARRFDDLYEQLRSTPGPSGDAVRRANERGWLPPECWTNRTINNPRSKPRPRRAA